MKSEKNIFYWLEKEIWVFSFSFVCSLFGMLAVLVWPHTRTFVREKLTMWVLSTPRQIRSTRFCKVLFFLMYCKLDFLFTQCSQPAHNCRAASMRNEWRKRLRKFLWRKKKMFSPSSRAWCFDVNLCVLHSVTNCIFSSMQLPRPLRIECKSLGIRLYQTSAVCKFPTFSHKSRARSCRTCGNNCTPHKKKCATIIHTHGISSWHDDKFSSDRK